MTDRIYLVDDENRLTPMTITPYPHEHLVQALLERYPDLLAGDQVDPENPRRWLLVRREADVVHDGEENHRWWMDHLFLDQDGVPTVVETKIAANPDLRRKVVGQILDYAANLAEDWTVERIRAEFEATCEGGSVPHTLVLSKHLEVGEEGLDDRAESFWQDVKTNLAAGRLRLVFVADVLPSSLVKVIEFMNGQMDPCEVIGVELPQFTSEADGKTLRALVPRVKGVTATSASRKQARRQAADPGVYILEPMADRLQDRFGLIPKRRMFRKGWVRFADPARPDAEDWLIYQSRSSRTVNVNFDRAGTLSPESMDRLVAWLSERVPSGARLTSGIDSAGNHFVRIEIPDFDYEDTANWDQLRERLEAAVRLVLEAVRSLDQQDR